MAETLQDQIIQAAEGLSLFVTVDLAAAPEAIGQLGVPAEDGFNLMGESQVEDIAAVGVWLLPLDGRDRDLRIARSLAIAEARPAVVWLASTLSTSSLAEGLRRRMDVQLADREELLLRYFDPRVLPEWVDCLGPTQRASFLAPALRWMWLDRAGELTMVSGHPTPDREPLDRPLQLDVRQEERLIDVSEANRALTLMLDDAPETLEALPVKLHYPLARRCGMELNALGLNSLGRRMAFMSVVAPCGDVDPFFESQLWHSIRARLSAGSITFDHALEEMAQRTSPALP
jgi:hypothetical protein